ncbi:MAG: hypothetical protein P8L85_18220 [Rubripirellula sp.]|nr:hypothetical protein [Rubripirellula sp.]
MLGGWGVWSQRGKHILKITAIQIAAQWTGDGGKIIEVSAEGRVSAEGQALTGGTLEARSLDSFVELQFRDGSQLT